MWEKSFSIDLIRHVIIVIPISKNCLVNHGRFKRHILCLQLKTMEKYDFLERGCSRNRISNWQETKATCNWSSWKKRWKDEDQKTLYSCRCGCKLGESKTDKAFTQHKMINITKLQITKNQSPQINIFERHLKRQSNLCIRESITIHVG